MLITLAPFVLIAAGLVLCVYVFLTLKKETYALKGRQDNHEIKVEAALQGVRAELDQLRQSLREMEETTGMMVAPEPPRSGLNLNKRSQALRMYRRGEVSEQIATALGLPRREVDLLLKVQKIVIGSSDLPTA